MSDEQPKKMRARKPSWSRMAFIAGVVLVIDQITKFLAVKHLTFAMGKNAGFSQNIHTFLTSRHLMNETGGYHYDFIQAFWSHRYAENPGAAWSFLASAPESIRVPFFFMISVVAIVLIGWYYTNLKSDQRLLQLALSLVMGGALGNLVDRGIRGYVIDFIDWHLADPDWHSRWHWPTFNVADSGISVGVGLIALDTLLAWWHARKAPKASPARTVPPPAADAPAK